MDERDKARIDLKFGKFTDPFVIVMILTLVFLSILAVTNLTPQTHPSRGEKILGITEDSRNHLELVEGKHNYIVEENLEQISKKHFKYTTFIKPNMQPRISKPILEINNDYKNMRSKVFYSNDSNFRVSLIDIENEVSYLMIDQKERYTQNIPIQDTGPTLYLAIENTQPVFFSQYIEIHFFLE